MSDKNRTTFSRRAVLSGAAAIGLGSFATPSEAVTDAANPHIRVPGVQLYTVRAAMEKDVAGTMQAIAAIGFKEVESAGYWDHTPQQFGNLLSDLDLTSPCAHGDSRKLRDDPLPIIEAAAEVGQKYVAIAWLHEEDRQTLDDYKRWAKACNRVGEACKQFGMRAAYHNHDFELLPIDGILPLDVLLSETDASLVDFELDMFWVRKAGAEILPILRKAPNRFTMAHIKDMDESGGMADVGKGLIDFARILSDPAAASIRHCFVEHDEPEDAFKSAAIGRLALSAILD